MTIEQYLDNINQRFKLGNYTEHTFRGDLQQLIESLQPEIQATNEPTRQKCGAPDYILTKKEIPVGFIEAKNIGDADLYGKKKSGNKEQFDRYKESLSNLILTDYLHFIIYQDGELITELKIADVENGIIPIPENFGPFENLIGSFCTHISQNISSSKKLAQMMAGKARLLSDVIEKSLNSDETHEEDSTLKQQMSAFKSILIHDITAKGFADVYAQTIAYGLFAARLHDPTLNTFSRQEAAELIPKSNPFLRKLFGYIAGPDIDDRIKWIVDHLVEIFLACNVEELLVNYGKETKMEDPVIHFYEDFLAEYDPKLRKARGVWYTPAPVVNFIVRAVDEILKTEFGLSDGLADTSKTKIKIKTQTADKRSKTGFTEIEQEVHKVQILDPATGTGTFLAEVIKLVHQKFKGQEGIWSNYVENDLIPRLNGFELLMASYAMAHLKLDLLLNELGFKATKNQRLKVFLSNSLEEAHPDANTLFDRWLSTESNEANRIKRDTPIMCVIGNPPYAVSSTNKNEWIQNLISDYKKNLNERKINLDDDYIKFIRYGQHYIDKNGSGVLAYISNNSFIDGITHRQMRKNLLMSFDKIYILDLHGSTKKHETTPTGGKDENVFDIQQGVSINIFVKNKNTVLKDLGVIYHKNLFGLREAKYNYLSQNNLSSIEWNKLELKQPYFFFVPKDFEAQDQYSKGFKISELFKIINNGLQTDRDSLFIDFEKERLSNRIKTLFQKEYDDLFIRKYNVKDSSSYKLSKVINSNEFDPKWVSSVLYRPLDYRYIYYDPAVISRPAQKVLKHLKHENLGLIIARQQSTYDFQHIFITKILTERCSISLQTKETGYVFPLYLYEDNTKVKNLDYGLSKIPNFNIDILKKICGAIQLNISNAELKNKSTFTPIDLLDYIYPILHSPTYREKYKEFLKIDFPRIPYPKDQTTFWKLVALGDELRQIHLLESPKVSKYITSYPIDGDNIITRKLTKTSIGFEPNGGDKGKVWINDQQYFDNVPLIAWEFYIGGYQPAQKWLKDRKGRTLDYNDILHYQKIIVALTETDRIMKEIDKIEIE